MTTNTNTPQRMKECHRLCESMESDPIDSCEINRHGNMPGSVEGADAVTPELLKQTIKDMNDAMKGKINVDCSKLSCAIN